MSRWEQEGSIDAAYRDGTTGELMLSASDVVAWLRHHATTAKPCRVGPIADTLADHLSSLCIDATRNLVDGSGS